MEDMIFVENWKYIHIYFITNTYLAVLNICLF